MQQKILYPTASIIVTLDVNNFLFIPAGPVDNWIFGMFRHLRGSKRLVADALGKCPYLENCLSYSEDSGTIIIMSSSSIYWYEL